MSDKLAYVRSLNYHKQAKETLLHELLVLMENIRCETSISNTKKFKTLCEGYETVRQLMEEVGTQETK